MADFVNSLDPSKLLLAETALSFIITPFNAPSYNFPLFLFGIYAQETSDAVQSLQLFSALLFASGVFDIIYLASHEQGTFVKLVHIFVLVLKLPTFVAFAGALRSRGATQFSGLGSISGMGGLRGADTVWSMPGGFTSSGRDGYQTVDDPEPRQQPAARQPPAAAPQAAPQNAPGAYQTV